jgi:hypothetical protein
MVCTHTCDFVLDVPEGSGARHGVAPTRPRGTAPASPPPPALPLPPMRIELLLATQNEIMQVLTENLLHRGGRWPHYQQVLDSSYTDFLAMHPRTFTKASDPLEEYTWLRITECKFGLLHCTELQKTLYAAQQLHVPASVWWANFTSTLHDDHQVSWAKFHWAFRGHHIPTRLSSCTCSRVRGVSTSTIRGLTTSHRMTPTTPTPMRRR